MERKSLTSLPLPSNGEDLENRKILLACDEKLYHTVEMLKTKYGAVKKVVSSDYNNKNRRAFRGKFFASKAWLKLHEINTSCLHNLINTDEKTLNVCDLCSAPGSFSQYILDQNERCSVVSVYEPHSSLKVKKNPRLTQIESNVTDVERTIQRLLPYAPFDLIVADGAQVFTNQTNNFNEENINSKLIQSEVEVSLKSLQPGGTLVLKLFATLTMKSIWTLNLLINSFVHVYMCKPVSSNLRNSEIYIVCEGYYNNAELPTISLETLKKIYEINNYRLECQKFALIDFLTH